MQALQHAHYPVYHQLGKKRTLVNKFITWCGTQEKYRFGWLAGIVAGHGCFITPIALFFVMAAGNSFLLWSFVIGAMALPLITNLAALPTKVTLPVFFLSLLVDVAVIIYCLKLLVG